MLPDPTRLAHKGSNTRGLPLVPRKPSKSRRDRPRPEASGLVSPTVARFARERLTEDPDASIPIADLYASYSDFCTAAKERPLVLGKFCRKLRQVFPEIRRVRSSQGGRPWMYEGLGIRRGGNP